jgi:internalin A
MAQEFSPLSLRERFLIFTYKFITMKKKINKVINKIEYFYKDFSTTFNRAASLDEIQEVEKFIGIEFPQELRDLYLECNGQKNNVKVGLFFGLPFSSLEELKREWRNFDELSKSGMPSLDNSVNSIPIKRIKEQYINTKHIPIASDGGGNFLCIDMDPDSKGTKGQIINIGRDENNRYVISENLSHFFDLILYSFESNSDLLSTYKNESHFFDYLSGMSLPFDSNINRFTDNQDNFEDWYSTLDVNWKSIVDNNIKKKNFEEIKKVIELNLMQSGIISLEPIKKFENVKEIILTGTEVENLQPLSKLENLKSLYLAKTKLKDLSSLKSLKNLKKLSLGNATINNISALNSLTMLTELSVEGFGEFDLANIENLTKLKILDISNNTLKNTDLLSKFKNIVDLQISDTNICSLSFMSNLKKLKDLKIGGLRIVDFNPLKISKLANVTCSFDDFANITNVIDYRVHFTITGIINDVQGQVLSNYVMKGETPKIS